MAFQFGLSKWINDGLSSSLRVCIRRRSFGNAPDGEPINGVNDYCLPSKDPISLPGIEMLAENATTTYRFLFWTYSQLTTTSSGTYFENVFTDELSPTIQTPTPHSNATAWYWGHVHVTPPPDVPPNVVITAVSMESLQYITKSPLQNSNQTSIPIVGKEVKLVAKAKLDGLTFKKWMIYYSDGLITSHSGREFTFPKDENRSALAIALYDTPHLKPNDKLDYDLIAGFLNAKPGGLEGTVDDSGSDPIIPCDPLLSFEAAEVFKKLNDPEKHLLVKMLAIDPESFEKLKGMLQGKGKAPKQTKPRKSKK